MEFNYYMQIECMWKYLTKTPASDNTQVGWCLNTFSTMIDDIWQAIQFICYEAIFSLYLITFVEVSIEEGK